MRGRRLGALVGAAATAAAGIAAAGAATAWGQARTLHLVERATTDTTVDLGARGDSTGDLLTFHNRVYDRANRRRLGTNLGHCVRIVPGESYDCAWTVFLRGGHISVYGPFYDERDSTLTITGGTGRYRGARGEMRLHARSATTFDFVYRLAG